MSTLWDDAEQIRTRSPLIHNITNYVVMNVTANALLAVGASPVMAHALEEVEEMVDIAAAVVLNLGTLSAPWIEAMFLAGHRAKRRGIPIVLDPVGAGATTFRTQTARRALEELRPSVVRGNASEILALAGTEGSTKGVDSTQQSEQALEAARVLSTQFSCVVSVSGARDLVVEAQRVARIDNGHPMMAKVTGSGCVATALTGAFVAINPVAFEAAAHAMLLSGIAGELAAAGAEGPGSYQSRFLDQLYGLRGEQLRQAIRLA